MRLSRAALLTAAGSLALAAGPAAAAPARTKTLDKDHLTAAWSFGPATGVFGDALIASKAPCTAVAQTCDATLVRVEDAGTLSVQTSTADQTLVDIDVYFYESDADGTKGYQMAKGTAFSSSESVAADVEPGYVLVDVQYMTGYGSYDAAASLTLPEPE